MSSRSPSGRLHSRRWASVRLEALERDGWRCRDCGKAGALEVHHVQPVAAGGAEFDLGNLRTLCRGCHVAVHRRPALPGEDAWAAAVMELESSGR